MDSAFVVSLSELMAAVGPWVTYFVQKQNPSEDAGRIAAKTVSLLRVFRAYGSATWRENGMTVTHSEMILQDAVPGGK